MTETIVYRAQNIITMDPNRPLATHVMVRGDRILAVGGDEVVDLWGGAPVDERFADKVLMPGLIEAHAHVSAGGVWRYIYCGHYTRTDPSGRGWPGVTEADALVDRLREAARVLPAGAPVVGWGFDPARLSGALDRQVLDRVASDRPVVVVPVADVLNPDTAMVIQPGWVRFGERPGVTVEGISPATVRVAFEPIQRVVLAPALRFTGELPDTLALAARPAPSVRELRVSGPRSRTDVLDSIPLTPIDLGAIAASGPVPARVDTARVQGVQVQPLSLEVDFRVEARENRTLELPSPPPPEWLAGAEGYPSRVAVEVTGAASLVRALAPGSLLLVATFPDDPGPDWESVEVSFRVQGLPSLLEARVEPVEVRREDP